MATQISETLQKMNELRQEMSAVRQLPDEERQAQMAQLIPQMQEAAQQLNALREQDRTLQFYLLGKQLGLPDEKAQGLAPTVQQILQNTQYGRGWGGGGRGEPGR